ncbi:MAG: type II toxin-antitoxin system death-on-curing family toxin [Tepidisphaeraceae bacterium]|jgi:death-on-curing protein
MPHILLSVEEVLEIHREQIRRHGGSAEVRDMGLLESAVGAATASVGGQPLHEDLFQTAAAYLFHIVKNHPFVDGNKRAGTAAALVFLDLNGIDIRKDEPAFSDLVLSVAQNKADKPLIAEYLRSRAR